MFSFPAFGLSLSAAVGSAFLFFPGAQIKRTGRNDSEWLPWLICSIGISAVFSLRKPPLFVAVFPIIFAGALALRKRRAGQSVKKRAAESIAELPVVVELLSLSVSAGEAPASALERVGMASKGPVGQAVQTAVAKMADGLTLVQALEAIKGELSLAQVDRAIDAIIIGYERGTSLGDLLHAQVLEVREEYRRSLIEHSARAEIAMMVPVVFLIMPVTILFALFPSLQALTSAY